MKVQKNVATERHIHLRFIPCYGIGGGIDIDRKDTSPQRGGTWEYDNTKYQPPLYHNYEIGEQSID